MRVFRILTRLGRAGAQWLVAILGVYAVSTPVPPWRAVLCFELHGVVLRLLVRAT